MQTYRIITIDAFSAQPFAGNPCAVLPEAEGLSDAQMQAIAREMNLSETAFVFPSERADFRVRYFTPRGELPFAGHPTIATAFMLAEERYIPLQEPVTQLTLEFQIGVLPVEVWIGKGGPQRVVMTQQVPSFGVSFTAERVAGCFGLSPDDLREDCVPQVVSTGVGFLIVPARDVATLGKVRMDRQMLAELCQEAGVSAAFMFSLGGFSPEADTHARLFDPQGTNEDPYTGSAAGAMGGYIVYHGLKPGHKLVAEQGHFVGRPGEGLLEIDGKRGSIDRVRLGGAAVKVLDGQIRVV